MNTSCNSRSIFETVASIIKQYNSGKAGKFFSFILPLALLCAVLSSPVNDAYAGQVPLSWNAPTTDADGTPLTYFSGNYKVYYGTSSRNYTQTIAVNNINSSVTYQVPNLTPGQPYYFAVTAVNTLGNESSYSNEVIKTAAGATYTLTATAVSSSQINLAWTASTNDTGVAGYKVYRSGTLIATTVNKNYSNTGLLPSTIYSYSVSAYYADGTESARSPQVSATTLAASSDTQAPSVPAGLTATAVSSSQINLSWNASSDNVAVTGYKVYRNGVQIVTTANTTYSNPGLSPSTAYTYTVSSYDAAGNNSSASTAALATTAQATTATSSTKTTITVTVTQSDGTTPISTARLYLKRGTTLVTTGYSNVAGVWIFSNLNPDATYNVVAYKSGVNFGNGAGQMSAPVSADTSAPANVTLLIKAQ